MTCNVCGNVLAVGDWPFCPHGRGTSNAIGDECDIWQENGFKHPRHFTSKIERRRALAERGLEERVCYEGPADRHVSRWAGMDQYTLDAATALVSRPGAVGPPDPPPPSIPMSWTVKER